MHLHNVSTDILKVLKVFLSLLYIFNFIKLYIYMYQALFGTSENQHFTMYAFTSIFANRCNSDVGKIRGRQTTSLGSGCFRHGIIVHELGHLVGFQHEQNRPDREQYVKINYENIQESKWIPRATKSH